MTKDEAYKKAEGIQKSYLDVLFSYGPIIPNSAKLKIAKQLSIPQLPNLGCKPSGTQNKVQS